MKNENYVELSAKLIAYSIPIQELQDEGVKTLADLIGYCARVSNPSNQLNINTTNQLMRYLIKHKHWSPFEIANVCIEINAPRDISRQILRHRSFSFQEFSQRYSAIQDLGFENDYKFRELRFQDDKNRQNSIETEDIEINTSKIKEAWLEHQRKVLDTSFAAYKFALENKIAKEQARVVLPEGLTPSRLYVNGTIRSWLHFLDVRTDKSTQKEHRIVAEKVRDVLLSKFDYKSLTAETK